MGYSCNACGRYVEGGGGCGCYSPSVSREESTIERLKAQLQSEKARADAAEADSKRLDWMIANSRSLHRGNGGWYTYPFYDLDSRGYPPAATPRHPTAREAIDAAIAAQGDAGEG